MSSDRNTRPEIVAEFLKDRPRYLELGLEVEAGIRHLRDEANKVATSRLEEDLAGWERKKTGWLFSKKNAGWQGPNWAGVWLWRATAGSLDFVVGVEGWPEPVPDLKRSFLEAGHGAIGSSDAWCRPREGSRKLEWNFRGDSLLLPVHRNKGIEEIIGLVFALREVADGTAAG